MPHIENTAFEPKNTNGVYNGLGNVTGLFRSPSGTAMIPEECPAGYLCVQDSLMPLEGYDSATNGNSWYFKPCATPKVDGLPADRTGIFASNTYKEVEVKGDDLVYELGVNTLGIPIPELERGTFTELMVGEVYKFGEGNFASPPNEGDYVPIDGPMFGAGASEPPDDDGAVWGEVLRVEPFNDGPRYYGNGYCVKIFRNGQSEEPPTPPTPPTPPEPGDETQFIKFLEGSTDTINIPDGTTSIRRYAMQYAPFTTITIPDSVTEIGQNALAGVRVESLTIPASVTNIGPNAFRDCPYLETLVIEGPASGTVTMGNGAFANCQKLKNITLSPSIKELPNTAFASNYALEEIVIPEGVEKLGTYMFQNCRELASVTLPSTLTTIGYNAFDGCIMLSSITLPNSITSIQQQAFNGSGLGVIRFPNSITGIYYGTCRNCRWLATAIIPEGITLIAKDVFYNCTNLTNVVLPSTIATIGENAFYGCQGPIYCRFSEGAVTGAPWGCTGEIIYDYNG